MGQTTTRTAAPSGTAPGTAVAVHVTGLIEQTFTLVERLRHAAETSLRTVQDKEKQALAALAPQVSAALGGLITGAGVITTPLADGLAAVEWWMVTGPGARTRLDLDLDPASDSFVDVGRQTWFAVPRETGKRHVTGPYVDYVCAEQYTLTFSVPLIRDGVFAGIAGADVFVGDFERAIRPMLRSAGVPLALVNTQGRIVAGNTAHHITGSLIREPHIRTALQEAAVRQPVAQTLTGGVILTPCENLPLAVLEWPVQTR
ncbi:cache domain-containing protein [Actinoplanes sp. GCM10030250]|uniref:cache domain-containing protein n=1 Tax=Actinoplanes sp. GCM10030250 TaxID=3273376 RepID=UPI00360E62B2